MMFIGILDILFFFNPSATYIHAFYPFNITFLSPIFHAKIKDEIKKTFEINRTHTKN